MWVGQDVALYGQTDEVSSLLALYVPLSQGAQEPVGKWLLKMDLNWDVPWMSRGGNILNGRSMLNHFQATGLKTKLAIGHRTRFVWNRWIQTLWKSKRARIGFKHIISRHKRKEEGNQKETRSCEGEKECTYCLACSSLSQPARWRDHHWRL